MSSYLKWKSPLKLETVLAKSSISYPSIYKDHIYWLEFLPQEHGRVALMQQDVNGNKQCITPDNVSLRTKANEYGGNCYLIADNKQFFINGKDQAIYCQPLDLSEPAKRVSPEQQDGYTCMYADMLFVAKSQTIIAVCEQTIPNEENKATIVAININTGEQTTLVEGANFYSSIRVNVDNNQLAWIQWHHPNMPWDDTELWTAEIDFSDLKLQNATAVIAEKGACVCQPLFAENGGLFFAVDYANAKQPEQNYWNLYCYLNKQTQSVTTGQQEFGAPHWVFGDNRLANIDNKHILAICSGETGENKLLKINTENFQQTTIIDDAVSVANLSANVEQGKAAILSSTTQRGNELKLWSNNQLHTVVQAKQVIDDQDISTGKHISYPTTDGDIAHAYYYQPVNSQYGAQQDELPPLLVMVHGGPTARTSNALDLQKQYWTTHGFAVLDINHRGSTGYGRQYRDALLNQWGEVDAQDIAKGVEYVISQGWVNEQQVCIRGKSAGGYAVLRALTEFPDTFRAGACYYGIGNLVTLAEITHKFEKHYTDMLLGEKFISAEQVDENSLYYQRSPLNFMQNIKSAMILFQGLDDKVVPPALSREVVETLKKLDLVHEYVEYPDEGHGFRQLQTNIDALTKELNFYRRILDS